MDLRGDLLLEERFMDLRERERDLLDLRIALREGERILRLGDFEALRLGDFEALRLGDAERDLRA
jgi:hypothetical protein